MEPQESQQPELDLTKSKIKRFQPIWRVCLIANFGLAAYMFATERKKNMNISIPKEPLPAKKEEEEEKKPSEEEEDLSDYTLWEPEFSSAPPAIPIPKEPLPKDQQLELFKWMLEEKRKVTPKDPAEKKRIDDDKAILKKFIKTESTPKL